MAMAAVSALLVLALISTVRRFATESLPSHLLHAASSPISNSPPTVSIAPLKPTDRGVQPVRAVSKPAVVERKPVNTAQAIKPKRQRSGDDDYVARDTYVYYGNKPNGSH